jgi:hypothetical protein
MNPMMGHVTDVRFDRARALTAVFCHEYRTGPYDEEGPFGPNSCGPATAELFVHYSSGPFIFLLWHPFE